MPVFGYPWQEKVASDMEEQAARMKEQAARVRQRAREEAESETLKLNESFEVTSLFAT